MAKASPQSHLPAAGMIRTSVDLPREMVEDIRLLLTLNPTGPQTFKALVVALLQERLERDRPAIKKVKALQTKR